ncbi:MAG: hypothetical protein IPK16_03800 [Anaerolineales bacterium]|nr:hypothetical protein [Anaerolineales bacterium]
MSRVDTLPPARYAVYVDVSAKLEQWHKPSAIAVANDHTRVLLVTAATKQAAARLLAHNPEPAQYILLATLTYLAVRPELENLSSITLDQDYSGLVAERRILRRLLHLLRQDRPRLKASALRMENIAGSRADVLARAVYKGASRPNRVVTLAEIERLL